MTNLSIDHIDDPLQRVDKNIRPYLEDNPFLLNHTDDIHTLQNEKKKKIRIRIHVESIVVDLRVQPVLLCDRILENPQYSFSQCEQLDPPTAGRQ